LLRRGVDLLRESNTRAMDKRATRLPRKPTGLRLFDPLLVAIGLDEDETRHIEVNSLRHPGRGEQVGLTNGIASDPLVWASWLFTAEFESDQGLKVWRRELSLERG